VISWPEVISAQMAGFASRNSNRARDKIFAAASMRRSHANRHAAFMPQELRIGRNLSCAYSNREFQPALAKSGGPW
jgi:hypothetical protein